MGECFPALPSSPTGRDIIHFYPWIIWAFDKAGHREFDDNFIERFRRADCLFCLAVLVDAPPPVSLSIYAIFANRKISVLARNFLEFVAKRFSRGF